MLVERGRRWGRDYRKSTSPESSWKERERVKTPIRDRTKKGERRKEKGERRKERVSIPLGLYKQGHRVRRGNKYH